MKKKIGLVVAIIFVGALAFGVSRMVQNPEQYQNTSETVPVVFDALQYEVKDGENITEAELINQLGEPDSIEEWNYEVGGGQYYRKRQIEI